MQNQKNYRSTKFNLDALRNLDQEEIKKAKDIYPILTQKQKDLIRHQAPAAFNLISKIITESNESIKNAHYNSINSQNKDSKQANKFNKSIYKSENSSEEKNAAYNVNDRQHERSTEARKSMHTETMNTIKLATVTVAVAATITGVFLGLKNKI